MRCLVSSIASIAMLAIMACRAAAASDLEECLSGDLAQRGPACTRVIGSTAETTENRGAAYIARGRVLRKHGDFDAGVEDFSAAIRLNERSIEAYVGRALTYIGMEHWDRAIQDYTSALVLDPLDAEAFFSRGNAYAAIGDADRALQDYQSAAKAYVGEPEYVIAHGLALQAKGDITEAITLYTSAMSYKRPPEHKASLLFFRGNAYARGRYWEQAIADYSESIRLDPSITGAYLARGIALVSKRDFDAALADFTAGARLDSKDAKFYSLRALIYGVKGDFNNAISDHDKAIELDPLDAYRYTRRAWTYLKAGKPQAGLKDANRALALKPRLASAYATRGNIHEALGHKVAAREDFNSAFSIAPGMRQAKEGLTRLAVGIVPQAATVAALTQAEERDLKAKTVFKECDLCPEMVVVPAGSFQMGSLLNERRYKTWQGKWLDGHPEEGPIHRVSIRSPFAIGKFEVTVEQFQAFIAETKHETGSACQAEAVEEHLYGGSVMIGTNKQLAGYSWQNPGHAQSDRFPVVCITWYDAKAYTQWLSKKTGKSYRLLAEAEWEYGARAGTTTRYHFGADSNKLCRYGNVMDAAMRNYYVGKTTSFYGDIDGKPSLSLPCDDGSAFAATVGTFIPNSFGLHDIHGNVKEFVEDCWHTDYRGAPTDGSAWTNGCYQEANSIGHVIRGGSWKSSSNGLRLALRESDFPDGKGLRYSNIGFRVARTILP